ncbi:MAG TPA: hypothetical protein VJR30_19140 [Bradyrhizobium sp.]|nr:hypothetical protein [Bradyrhizobium sp.]
MNRIWIALAAVTLGALMAPAHAAPPTATPSPGYDARLQESRRGPATMTFTPAPRPAKPKPKKPPQH